MLWLCRGLMLTLAAADCDAPSSSKSLLQVHRDDSVVQTSSRTASDGACSYDVYIGRSDWGWDQYWQKVIVSAPKGESFNFDGCDTTSAAGQACHNGMGIHVLRDSKGNQVGTGTCCSGLTNKVLRVISNECSDECLYTLDIYRGGPDNFAKWFQKNTTKPKGEIFAFTDCITDTGNGQACVDNYGSPDGIRIYTDFVGNRVGTGTCCNSETNKVEIAEEVCPTTCKYNLHIVSEYVAYTSMTGMEEMNLGSSNSISGTHEVEDAENEEFAFDGCSTTIPAGKVCQDQHGIPEGVRVVKNKQGQIVASGDCCSSDRKNRLRQENGPCLDR